MSRSATLAKIYSLLGNKIVMIHPREIKRSWLPTWMIAVIFALSMQSSHADVTDATAVDYLRVEKTKAAVMVMQVKTQFLPGSPEYNTAKQKYAAAQQAFNSYTRAMLGSYALGTKADLSASAQLAYTKAEDFQKYISSLNLQSKGFVAVFVAVGVLIDIGDKLYTVLTSKEKEERAARTKQLSLEVTWDDWDRV